MCRRCNIEVKGNNAKENHICRMPGDDSLNTCSFCKVDFFSKEDKQSHECEHHPYKSVFQQRKELQRANTECSNGAECWRAARNKCWFKHSQQVNISRTNSARPQLYCRYQDQCFKGKEHCRFKHIDQGFQEPNQSRTNQ